jgi:hypothetical protein
MGGTSLAERPGTPCGLRTCHSEDGLSAFVFEFEFDLELASDDNLCTLHSCWTHEEAAVAYKRPVWECKDRRGDADDDAGIAADGVEPPSASALASSQHAASQHAASQPAFASSAPVAAAALGAQPTQHALASQQCAYSSPACIDLASSYSFWAGSAPAADPTAGSASGRETVLASLANVSALKPAGTKKPRHAVKQMQFRSVEVHAK